jgi:hypothetical protein
MADSIQSPPDSRGGGTSRGTATGKRGGNNRPDRAMADVGNIGSELIGSVREGANSLFEEQRDRLADEIAAFGNVVRKSVEAIEESKSGAIARYADDVAQQVSGFAETLRGRSLSAMAGDVEDFARRWPIVFIASAVGLGFIGGRFLVSSASRRAAPTKPEAAPSPATASASEPRGGARHDSGAVSGPVSANANSGYGAAAKRETP